MIDLKKLDRELEQRILNRTDAIRDGSVDGMHALVASAVADALAEVRAAIQHSTLTQTR